jgi:hypothetical protein
LVRLTLAVEDECGATGEEWMDKEKSFFAKQSQTACTEMQLTSYE